MEALASEGFHDLSEGADNARAPGLDEEPERSLDVEPASSGDVASLPFVDEKRLRVQHLRESDRGGLALVERGRQLGIDTGSFDFTVHLDPRRR